MTESHNGPDMEKIAAAESAKRMTRVKGSGARKARAWLEDHARRTKDRMGRPPVIDRGTYARQQRARQPWTNESLFPEGVRRADRARSRTIEASIDPDRLLVPAEYVDSDLLHEPVLTRLKDMFIPYWAARVIEMDREEEAVIKKDLAKFGIQRTPKKERMTIQEAFDQQVYAYTAIVGGVEHAFQANPDLDEIELDHDLDNHAGVVLEKTMARKGLGRGRRKYDTNALSDEDHDFEESVNLADRFSRWIWNPAWLLAVRDIDEKYKGDPHHKVTQKILSTINQEGLDEYFWDLVVKEGLNDIFERKSLMSSSNGAALEFIPELLAEEEEKANPREGTRVRRITIQEALKRIHASKRIKEVVMDGLFEDKDSYLSDYDTKPLMMGVQLDNLIQAALARIVPPPSGMDPEMLFDLVKNTKMVMLADDAVASVQAHSGIVLVRTPRFIVPNGPDRTDFKPELFQEVSQHAVVVHPIRLGGQPPEGDPNNN